MYHYNQMSIQQQQQQQQHQFNEQDNSNPQAQDQVGLLGPSQPINNAQYPMRVANLQQQNSPQNSLDQRLDNGPIFRYQGMAINSTTVKLVWNLVSNSFADYFEIKYGPIPDIDVYSIKLNGSARDYTFHQLLPERQYQFHLQGFQNDQPFSHKPQWLTIKTPPLNYVGKSHADYINKDIMPLGVRAEAKSNNSIQLSWIEPERPANIRNSNRVNIIRYYINPSGLASTSETTNTTTASNMSSSPQYHYLNVTNAQRSSLIVQRLKPATEYAFAVKTAYYTPDMKKVFTQSGFSMDTIAKTFDLEPSSPRNFSIQQIPLTKEELLAGSTPKLELNWQPPESPNGQLRGYVILYSHEQSLQDDKWLRIHVNDSNINNWFVSNLRPGFSYYFKLRAINQRGQSGDSDTRLYMVPAAIQSTSSSSSSPPDNNKMIINNTPYPASNVLMLIVICLIAILFVLFLVVFCLLRRTRRKPRKGSLNQTTKQQSSGSMGGGGAKLNGFASTNSSSTVTARVGTLARRRQQTTASSAANEKTSNGDFWINAMDSQQEMKSNMSEKSNSDMNMAMVSIQRDSPHQFVTQTQLASVLPEYRQQMASAETQLMQQIQQQGHYHPGQFTGGLAYDQMDNATASALMTLTKRQQQQLQKYQIQFATTGQAPPQSMQQQQQAPSPHQQPPPPPPLNIEQQHQQQMISQQPLYGTHQALANTRSLRMHRPTLYDPVSGSFVQSGDNNNNNNNAGQPPNYNSHMHPILGTHNNGNLQFNNSFGGPTLGASNTLQFNHPHQTSTLMSRRSTNTLRSFQAGGNSTYGQLGSFAVPSPPSSLAGQQQPPVLQSHQAVINQLNQSTYPSLPLKHVSAVRPQIMSSLDDQIEMELAEKEQQLQQQQQHQQESQQQEQQQKATVKQ